MAGLAVSKDFGDTTQQAGLSSSLCRVESRPRLDFNREPLSTQLRNVRFGALAGAVVAVQLGLCFFCKNIEIKS